MQIPVWGGVLRWTRAIFVGFVGLVVLGCVGIYHVFTMRL